MANTVAQIRDVLQARKNVLRERYQVESLFLFGSMCKGTQRPDSDIDLLVRYATTPGIFEFVSLKLYLEESLGRPVDLVTEGALKKRMRSVILQEAVRVYSSAV